MAANLKSRVARLEGVSGGAEPLIIIIIIFGEPEAAFTGFEVDGKFVAPLTGESMQEAEDRIVAELDNRSDRLYHVVQPVYGPSSDLVAEVLK